MTGLLEKAEEQLRRAACGADFLDEVRRYRRARAVDPATPEPLPLPDGLPPVAAFDFAMLPDTLKPSARRMSAAGQGRYSGGRPPLIPRGAGTDRRVSVRPPLPRPRRRSRRSRGATTCHRATRELIGSGAGPRVRGSVRANGRGR
jgi:hypothetical protein